MGSYGPTTFVNILFDSLLLDDNLFKSQSFESTVLEMWFSKVAKVTYIPIWNSEEASKLVSFLSHHIQSI